MQDSVKIVPDTSIIINGKFLRLLQEECFENCEIIIPVAVIDELQAQASKGRDVGFKGLEQLKKIREVAEQKGYVIKFVGE
ncbi:MAG: ATPase, partial [Nitrososphaerota archaeon]